MGHESTVSHLVIAIAALLLIASGTLALSRRVKLPFTVLLVIVGIGLANLGEFGLPVAHGLFDIQVSRDVILYVFLPTLIFESAYHLDPRPLRDNLGPVLLLAVPGLLISTVIIAAIFSLATPVGFLAALVLGAMLSATDPVAVIALFRQLGAPERLTVLVEGESLFNDATAIVATQILLGVAVAGFLTTGAVASGVVEFLVVFVGGIVVGVGMALLAGWALGAVHDNPLIELSILGVLAYLSFLVGEELFHVSGVMATLAAGLTIAGWGRAKISPSVVQTIEQFWGYLAYVCNALIFLLVGLRVQLSGLLNQLDELLWLLLAMLLSRAVVVYGLVHLAGRLPGVERVGWRYQTVMFWGGLRGAVALALVLSLGDFPHAERFLNLVMGAVLFTLLVQGLTVEPLIRVLGLDRPSVSDELARTEGELEALQHATRRIPALGAGGLFSARIADRLEHRHREEIGHLRTRADALRGQRLGPEDERTLMALRCLSAEKSAYYSQFASHHLSEAAYRQLDHGVQARMDRLHHAARPMVVEEVDSPGQRLWRRLRAGAVGALQQTWFGERVRIWALAHDYEETWGRHQACTTVLDAIAEMAQVGSYTEALIIQVRGHYEQVRDTSKRSLDEWAEQFPEFVSAMQERLAERLILLVERDVIEQEITSGSLPGHLGHALAQELRERIRGLGALSVAQLRVDPSELLAKVPFLRDASAEEFQGIAEHLHPVTLPPDTEIIRQGELGTAMYLVARGVVRVSRTDDGVSHDLATLFAGDFLGEMALLSDEPRTATCRTVTPCVVYELTRRNLDVALAAFPEMRGALERTASQRAQAQREPAAPAPST